jgi:hypothetical protein
MRGRRHQIRDINGWLFCEGCQLMFVAPGCQPGTAKQRARFIRWHTTRRRRLAALSPEGRQNEKEEKKKE